MSQDDSQMTLESFFSSHLRIQSERIRITQSSPYNSPTLTCIFLFSGHTLLLALQVQLQGRGYGYQTEDFFKSTGLGGWSGRLGTVPSCNPRGSVTVERRIRKLLCFDGQCACMLRRGADFMYIFVSQPSLIGLYYTSAKT